MSQLIVEWVIVSLTSVISLAMLSILNQRLSIGLLAGQYLGVFFLISLEWALPLALTFLLAGWVAGVVLALALSNQPLLSESYDARNPTQPFKEKPRLTSSFFNLLISAIIILAALSFAPQVNLWIPTLDPLQGWVALLLSGLGLIHLAINPHPIATTIAVLTIFSGFEILYSGLTSTRLAVGLLACVTLFIALAGSYLFLAPFMKETE